MWLMIKKLKYNKEIENSESEVYNSDDIPLKQEEAVDSIILYWKEIYQKQNNDMKMVWTLKEKNSYVKHRMERRENVMATMLRLFHNLQESRLYRWNVGNILMC